MKAKAYIVHRAMAEPSLEWRKPSDCLSAEPLYSAREWVGLTDEEIDSTFETQVWDARRSYARAIEAKLREKNIL